MVKIDEYISKKDGTTKYSTKISYLGVDDSISFEVQMDRIFTRDASFNGKRFTTYGIAGIVEDKEVWVSLSKSVATLMENLGIEKGDVFKVTKTKEKFTPFKVEKTSGSSLSPSQVEIELTSVQVGLSPKEAEFLKEFKAVLNTNNLKQKDISKDTFTANAIKNNLPDKLNFEKLWDKFQEA